ncbi:hypothetical protein [Natronosalvus halobius]|uniref:hypothetical protein n=1 Tax=Natronosalvus halobius TaxID=2953746 RepID=UPI0020A194C9|nr:hypothetical protein [Natronosalvus halobius]USZ71208.1 hypothetical protein NGM15_14145 [Natronosalvus halobius]
MDEESATAANENASDEPDENTADEAELVAWVEQQHGRELTEEEENLSLAQARLIGEF